MICIETNKKYWLTALVSFMNCIYNCVGSCNAFSITLCSKLIKSISWNFFPCILQYFYLCLIVEVFIGWYRFDSYLNHGFILQNFPMICNLSCIVNSYLERRQKNKFSIILLDSKNGSMSSNIFGGILISTTILYLVGQYPNKNNVPTTFNF